MEDPGPIASADQSRATALLERCLSQRWPGARIDGVSVVPGDASSRRYIRCAICSGGTAAPRTLIVMLLEDSAVALSSDELGVFGEGGPRELPFVNVWRFLSRATDALPEIYHVAADQSGLVLEDVGDVSLWAAAHQPGQSAEALFARALDLLAAIQRAAVDDGRGCYAFSQAFDARLFDWEFEHYLEYGVAAAPASTLEACRRELAGVIERLDRLPRVFCHRDYHAWNVHVHDDRLRVIDFQDALLAPAFYDVASLLTDRFTPELISPELERRLVLRFADTVGDGGGVSSPDDALEIYRLCAFQRVLKVIGRFNYLAEQKGKPAYLEMLPAVVATAHRLTTDLEGLPATRELLDRHVKAGGARS